MKISVIIPCYNASKYIDKCIKSILKQTFKNFEIICINDCSTDDTLQKLYLYAEKCSKIHIISHKINKGLIQARITGINNSNGEYITFVDSDDYVKKDYLYKLYQATENDKIDLIISSGHLQKFRFFSIKRKDLPKYNYNLINKTIEFPYKTELSKNFFGVSQFPCYMWMKLYRKELLVNFTSIDIFQNEDVLINMNIFKKIKSLKFINYTGYYYRNGGGSSSNKQYIQDFKKLFFYKKSKIKDYNFNENFDPYIYILIELKNVFYEYFIRYILNGKENNHIITMIDNELTDDIYTNFNYLKNKNLDLFNSNEIQAIITKESYEILSIAKSKISVSRRLKHYISKHL